MTRRSLLSALFAAAPAAAGQTGEPAATLRGKLRLDADGRPVLQAADGKSVRLDGDEPTVGVLNDERLRDSDFEVKGTFGKDGVFAVGPIHTRAMFLLRDGKKKLITYWCEVCFIRTYTPGICWCCQEYTELDPQDP